jgi:hypothetical protein
MVEITKITIEDVPKRACVWVPRFILERTLGYIQGYRWGGYGGVVVLGGC